MKYKKKPIVINAIEWTGGNLDECMCFLGGDFISYRAEKHPDGKREIFVKTLEGSHVASKNDWIIRGVKGEHYPCKPEIFKTTYDIA
jgi:hypothetical protein